MQHGLVAAVFQFVEDGAEVGVVVRVCVAHVEHEEAAAFQRRRGPPSVSLLARMMCRRLGDMHGVLDTCLRWSDRAR